MLNPISFAAIKNTDTFYYHQAMKAPDTNKFQKVVIKEVNAHVKINHWELIPREQVQKGEQVLPYVWEFECKRDIKSNKVFTHKARLNVHRSKK